MPKLPDPDELVRALREATDPLSTRELATMFGIKKPDRPALRALLKDLARDGVVQRTSGKTWRIPPRRAERAPLTGTLSIARKGYGFVRLDPESAAAAGDPDVMIREDDLGKALEGDRVVVRIVEKSDRGSRGFIKEVLEHRQKHVVGRYQRTGPKHGIVIPLNQSVQRRIRVGIPPEELGVENFEFVNVEITAYTEHPRDLLGNITERIGHPHEKGIDVLLLLRDKGIVEEFPTIVQEHADKLRMDVKQELPRREDLRGLPTATIDPATAKDFDDALSIEAEPGGGWRLWVHIADVTHFVRPGDPIDVEARARSTSVYPVDRVVPMLPEKLSNDLCSLRPGEDRFTMTAEMVISPDGKLTGGEYYSSIIHSDRRFAYEEVQALYEEKPDAPNDVTPVQREQVFLLRDCARALRKARFARGALDLDIPELQVVFHDESGDVSHLELRERFEAHMVVEDCMLIANEAVANFLTRRKAPLLYRVHEQADPDRLEKLVPVLDAMDVPLRIGPKGVISPGDLQAALESIEDRPGGHIIRRLILRALKRAEYAPHNVGHFGLASKCYCHFTSPIRRYPDVVVHRQLRAVERAEPLPWPADKDGKNALKELGAHCSFREREAADAERDSNTIKGIEFIKQHEGEEFKGRISGIMPFGFFVELDPHGVEGLVHVRTLKDDRYDPDPFGLELVGQRGGRRYRLTDEVRVRVAKALPFEMELDLEIVEAPAADKRPHKPPRQRKGPPPFVQKKINRKKRKR